MEIVAGTVEKIIFHNEDNGFTIFLFNRKIKQANTKNCFMVKGTAFNIKIDDELTLTGNFHTDPKYGYEFILSSYKFNIPQRLDILEKYLSSGEIKGLGKNKAQQIINKFGTDTVRILKEEPEKLKEIRGIGPKLAERIALKICKQDEMQEIILNLTDFGINGNIANKIYIKYKDKTLQVIQHNPYQLIEDIKGVGFILADKIAADIGVSKNSNFRIRAGILYVLDMNNHNGNLYLPIEELKELSCKALNVKEIDEVLYDMISDDALKLINGYKVYKKHDYEIECNLAKNIKRVSKCKINYGIKESILKNCTKKLNEEQKASVRSAITKGLTIVTGGAGCGKTTSVKAMIDYFKKTKCKVLLAAPTGRAAKRMTESTNYEARTIHRLLEVHCTDGRMYFVHNKEKPLECDVLIIDEVSMLDTYLANSLFNAISSGTRVVLIGDKNQLPSVEPGCVLKDIINSQICTVIELKHIYRQSEESFIKKNANAVLTGEKLNLTNNCKDFFFKPSEDPKEIQKMLLHYTVDSLPDFTNEKDIQVLTPIKDGVLGVNELNTALQAKLNPYNKDFYGFREQDKVMQIVNDYEKLKVKNNKKSSGVFNGDTGVITKIDFKQKLVTVRFYDGWESVYSKSELKDLVLSYAMTIHKSQGGEFPVVVIPIYNYIPQLTSRNLLYTAITRASKTILLIGSYKRLYCMINNTEISKRNTSLLEMLKKDS